MERTKKAQDEGSWIANLETYRSGDIAKLNLEEAKTSSLIAPDYEVDECVLLFYSLRSATKAEDRAESARLVVPELLQQDFLHHYHTSLEGGHPGSAERIIVSGPLFTGELYTKVCGAM